MKKGSSYRFAAWVCACMIVVGSLAGGTEKAYGAGPGEQYGLYTRLLFFPGQNFQEGILAMIRWHT